MDRTVGLITFRTQERLLKSLSLKSRGLGHNAKLGQKSVPSMRVSGAENDFKRYDSNTTGEQRF